MVGVEVVVAGAELVDLAAHCPRLGFRGLVAAAEQAFDAFALGGVDKDVDAARVVAQNVVGGAANDDAAFGVAELANHVALRAIDSVVRDVTAGNVAAAGAEESEREGARKEGGLALVVALEDFGNESRLFRGVEQEAFVVELDAEALGELAAEFASAAAHLAAYGDDKRLFHG